MCVQEPEVMTEVRKVSRRHKTPRPRDRSSRRQERGHERLEAEADSKSAASSTRPPAGAEVETNETNGRRERDKWNIDPSKYTYFILLLVKVTVSFHLMSFFCLIQNSQRNHRYFCVRTALLLLPESPALRVARWRGRGSAQRPAPVPAPRS